MLKKIFLFSFLFLSIASAKNKSGICAIAVSNIKSFGQWTSHLKQLNTARKLAKTYHYQQWHGEMWWSEHLQAIEDILTEYGFGFSSTFDLKVRITAKLHDIIEDTKIKPELIRRKFSSYIVEAVYKVTFPADLKDEDRGPYLKIKLADNEIAKIVKIVDRLANFEMALMGYYENKSDFYSQKYINEWPHFAESAKPKDPRGLRLWEHLNQLMTNQIYREKFYINGSPNRKNPEFPRGLSKADREQAVLRKRAA